MCDPVRWPSRSERSRIILVMGVDVIDDYRSGVDVPHVILEGGIMVMALVGLVTLARQLIQAQREAEQLRVDLDVARREAERFREEAHEALRGLGEAIDHQFTRWNLTAAERREIGLLLLKGLRSGSSSGFVV